MGVPVALHQYMWYPGYAPSLLNALRNFWHVFHIVASRGYEGILDSGQLMLSINFEKG